VNNLNLQGLNSKQKILLSAKVEFAEKGLAGARTESIAKRASVNKAMIHYYFQSKENLYEVILNNIFTKDSKAFAKEEHNFFKNDDFTIPQKLYVIIFFIINIHAYLIDNDYHRIVAWEIAEGQKYLSKISNNIILPRWKAMSGLIEKGIKEGYFEVKSSIFAVINIVSFIHFYFSQSFHENFSIDRKNLENIDNFIEQATIMFFKSINKEESKLPNYMITDELKEEIKDKIKNMKENII